MDSEPHLLVALASMGVVEQDQVDEKDIGGDG